MTVDKENDLLGRLGVEADAVRLAHDYVQTINEAFSAKYGDSFRSLPMAAATGSMGAAVLAVLGEDAVDIWCHLVREYSKQFREHEETLAHDR